MSRHIDLRSGAHSWQWMADPIPDSGIVEIAVTSLKSAILSRFFIEAWNQDPIALLDSSLKADSRSSSDLEFTKILTTELGDLVVSELEYSDLTFHISREMISLLSSDSSGRRPELAALEHRALQLALKIHAGEGAISF